jgi:hypothetical protein
MNLAYELFAVAADREVAELDAKLLVDVFAQSPKPKTFAAGKKK